MRAFTLAFLSLASVAVAQNCGPQYNNQVCAAGKCCSQYGWVRPPTSHLPPPTSPTSSNPPPVRHRRRLLRPSHLPKVLLWKRLLLRVRNKALLHPEDIHKTHLHLFALHLPSPQHRRLRPRPGRRFLPRRRPRRLLLPLLLLGRPLRAQERHPGPESVLWHRMSARLRKVRQREEACESHGCARHGGRWRDVRSYRQ